MAKLTKAERDEQAQRELADAERVQQQRREGAAALDQSNAKDAEKTDDERKADEELARSQQEAAAKVEADRVAAEQKKAAAGAKDLPPEARVLAAGTVLHLNGYPVSLPVDAAVASAGFADERHFASVLAHDQKNFSLNSDRLRLVYNPMNGTPLPLDAQRLKPEDMTEQERGLFGLDQPVKPPKKK